MFLCAPLPQLSRASACVRSFGWMQKKRTTLTTATARMRNVTTTLRKMSDAVLVETLRKAIKRLVKEEMITWLTMHLKLLSARKIGQTVNS
eukprot:scaffold100722_cov18-Tisochrysis_lutea.AAC.2